MNGQRYKLWIPIVLFLGCTDAAGSDVTYAWWLTAEFEPHGTEVWGVPVEKLNDDWVAARSLDISDVPENTGPDRVRAQMQEYALSFQISSDFDNDSDVERAGVGVFERRDGSRGSFLIVVGSRGNVEFMEVTNSTKAGFGVLKVEKDGISFWYCLECSHGFYLKCTGPDSFQIIELDSYG